MTTLYSLYPHPVSMVFGFHGSDSYPYQILKAVKVPSSQDEQLSKRGGQSIDNMRHCLNTLNIIGDIPLVSIIAGIGRLILVMGIYSSINRDANSNNNDESCLQSRDIESINSSSSSQKFENEAIERMFDQSFLVGQVWRLCWELIGLGSVNAGFDVLATVMNNKFNPASLVANDVRFGVVY